MGLLARHLLWNWACHNSKLILCAILLGVVAKVFLGTVSVCSHIYHGLKIIGQFKAYRHKIGSCFKYISMVHVHKLTVEG